MTDEVERLVDAVIAGRKYRSVSRDLVAHVVQTLAGRPGRPEEKVKLARSKIHQVAFAYLEPAPSYDRWLRRIWSAASAGDRAALIEACRDAMRGHASTRERLPFLREFYATTIPDWSGIRTVVDIGCGLNPLSLALLDVPPHLEYVAYDVLGDLIDFLNAVFPLLGVNGHAELCDVVLAPERVRRPADLVLLLKTLPCLDQLEPDAGDRLLDAIEAQRLLVSFPLHALGGGRKGFGRTYEMRFLEYVERRGLAARRFIFPNELAFLVVRDS